MPPEEEQHGAGVQDGISLKRGRTTEKGSFSRHTQLLGRQLMQLLSGWNGKVERGEVESVEWWCHVSLRQSTA